MVNKINLILPELAFDPVKEFQLLDLKSKFNVLGEWAFIRLDNSIKQHLVRTNPKISQEIFTGFDTEYLPIDFGKNELLTCQLSICGLLKLFVPITKDFTFEGVSTLSSDVYLKSPPKFEEKSIFEIKKYFNNEIKEIRELKFGNHDQFMKSITNNVIKNSNELLVEHCVRVDNGYIFQLNRTPIKNIFIVPAPGEVLEINFDTLVKIINTSVNIEETSSELEEFLFDNCNDTLPLEENVVISMDP